MNGGGETLWLRITQKCTNCDFSSVNFNGAYLINADLSGSSLRGANLSGAFLTNANLSRTDLSDANLSGADLSYLTFFGKSANLSVAARNI